MPERKPHVFNAGDCVWAKAQNFNYWPALVKLNTCMFDQVVKV